MQDAHDLSLIISAGVALIALETHDENRAIDLLAGVARRRDTSLFRWTVTDGLKRGGFGLQVAGQNEYGEPEAVLEKIKNRGEPGIYALCDFHPWLTPESPKQIRQLKDIALRNHNGALCVVLVSHRIASHCLQSWRACARGSKYPCPVTNRYGESCARKPSTGHDVTATRE